MKLNNKENDNQRLFKAQKLALYWLLGLIYSGFIGLQLGRGINEHRIKDNLKLLSQ